MIAVVLMPFTCRGVAYDRGHFVNTEEPVPLHPSLERQLLEQRYMRQAQPDEFEAWRAMQAQAPLAKAAAEAPKRRTA